MRQRHLVFAGLLGLGALWACGPKQTPPADASWRAQQPAPLAPRPFVMPQAERGTLSNGLPVLVVNNPEVPMVYVTLVFRDGAWTDPADRPGLAAAAMDLMNEGAGDLDTEALSMALKRLASDLGTSAGTDGSSVSLSTLKKNLEPSLDLMTKVLLEPRMPADEWELLRKQRLADLATELKDPNAVSRRVFWRLLMGGSYMGNQPTEASLQAMKVEELRGWLSAHLRPDRAIAMVGGDITLAEIQPLLEARLARWTGPTTPGPTPPDASLLRGAEKTTIYLVDKPGASQSVIRAGLPVGRRDAPDAAALEMANEAIGGMFTARINMNLREQKGYTYGARTWTYYSYVPGVWIGSTSVRADATVDSVREILGELRAARTDRPITQAELDVARGNALGTFPLGYETPSGLLGGLRDEWTFGLPDGWVQRTPDRVRAVTLEEANAAWQRYVDPDRLTLVVVGDAASLREGLGGLGLPVSEVDLDGNPIGSRK